jgi:hypothetical protein
MIVLRDKETGRELGSLTELQLMSLIGQLEEEDPDDQDYWLNREMIETLRERGTDPDLVHMLENAIGDGVEVEVEWVRS